MRRGHKLLVTVATGVLVLPVLGLSLIYASGECGEMDPCATGGPLPYAWAALAGAFAAVLLALILLRIMWRRETVE